MFGVGSLRWSNVGALQLNQVFRQGSLILIAILLARSSLTTEEIGLYEMLMYLAYAVTFFWTTGLVQGLLSVYPRLEADQQGSMLRRSYLLVAFLSIATALLLGLGSQWLVPWLTGREQLPHYGLFLSYLLLLPPTFLLEHYFLLVERTRSILWLGVFSALVQVGGVLAALCLGCGLRGVLIALIAWVLFRHLWLLVFLFALGPAPKQRVALREWLLISLPLILYALLGGLHQVFDIWLVGFHYRGDEQQFALFRYGARELPLLLALTGAFATALLPELARSPSDGLKQLREKSRPLYHLFFPMSILLMLTSYWWFPRLFSEAFSPSVLVFNVFLLLIVHRLLFPRTVLMGLQDNTVLLWISLGELALNALLSFWLVGRLGLAGIALGTVLAYSIGKGGMCWVLYRRHGIRVGQYTDLRLLAVYSALLLVAFFAAL